MFVEQFSPALDGFSVVFQTTNLIFLFVGVLAGTAIGVLPGLGPTATIALLIPLTYDAPPETAIILLAGVYYGAMYGGTITSVLLQLPGESASVVTVLDGYQMAKQGRAGSALGIAAIGSFFGGTVSIVALTFLAPTLAAVALRFGPPEYAALALLGLTLITYLGTQSPTRSIVVATVGLLLGTVGRDPVFGGTRFGFDTLQLEDALDFAPVAMGLFGVGEILYALDRSEQASLIKGRISNVWPSLSDISASKYAILRGSVVGFVLGLLPGGGGTVASMASYAQERRRAKDPERFGQGAIEGVAGPETANNAAATSSFVPLLTLGIPTNVVMALLFGALVLHGITPGPRMIEQHPDVFWGVVDSMYVGNLMLLLLNIPLVGLFVQLLRVKASILAPITLMVTMLGAYAIKNGLFDVWLTLGFGILGYLMRKYGFQPGPLVLAFVLGPILEKSVRQSLLMSNGDFFIFLGRPVSLLLLLATVATVILSVTSARRVKASRRNRVAEEHASADV
jgi:putative tricarboxylic transport membrane protein